MTKDSVRRAVRTFIITGLALFVPGLLGWLNDLTQWAAGNGTKPFPDGHGLAYLGVSAIVAGVVAVVNLLWNAVEDATGRGLLRAVPARVTPGETGAVDVVRALVIAILAVVLVVVVLALVR